MTIDEVLKRLNVTDPTQVALARAGATRLATLDAIAREQFISSALMDRDPAVRAVAVLGMDAIEAEQAAYVPPPPPEMDAEMKAVFDKIDAHFRPPEVKKESAP